MSIAPGPSQPVDLPASRAAEMPSVLHLVRPATLLDRPALGPARIWWSMGSDAGTLACRAAIDATPRLNHKVIVVGGGAAGQRAAALGLAATARTAPPFGRAELAGPALTRWLRTYGAPRVIQGWGAEFAGLRGRTGAPRISWCVADLDNGILESRMEHWPPVTSAMTPWLGDALPLPRHAPPAGQDWRVLLLGDPPGAMDALAFIYTLGILHVAGIRTTALVPRASGRLDRALRHIRAGGYAHRLELLDGPALAALSSCHLAVCVPLRVGDGPAPLEPSFATKVGVSAACAAGLPVLMQDSPWSRTLLPEGAHACLAPSLDPAKLASAACALLTGPGLAQSRAALAGGLRAPARTMTTEVTQAWGISAMAGAAR